MTDDEVKQWLMLEERMWLDRCQRRADEEHAFVRNEDGSARLTYVAGPWVAFMASLHALADMRRRVTLSAQRAWADERGCPWCAQSKQDGHRAECVVPEGSA